jgi:long-chain fatty acid transport protein
MKKTIVLLLSAILIGSIAFGGGYQVRLQGQKQTGIGLIGTPFTYGASSIFYNPGSLALYKGTWSFEAGVSTLFSNGAFQKEGTNYVARTDTPIGTPLYFYGAGKVNKHIALGIGVYTPYGSSGKWEEGWAGRYLIQDISFKAYFIQPTIAYQIKDKFGIGVGFVYAFGNVDLKKSLPYNDNSTVDLKGTTSNIGFNIGAFWKPIEKLSIGIGYRSKILMKITDGDATFTVPAALSSTLPASNKFSSEMPLPANLDFGISYDITEKFLLAVEVNWVQWSAYKSLDFTFEQQGDLLNTVNPRNYKDRLIPRIGGQYKLNDMFTFRAGFYYDNTPTDENYFTPETISLNTIAFTLGASIQPVKGLNIDLSYLELHGLQAKKNYEPANFSGEYKTITLIPGIGLSYQF